MIDFTGLINRLRGVYRIPITDGLGATGGGEEPDNPNEFVRHFETPPIQKEAANAIESLLKENETWNAAIDAAIAEFNKLEERRIRRPCPDGIEGCAVFHFTKVQSPRKPPEILYAIKMLKK